MRRKDVAAVALVLLLKGCQTLSVDALSIDDDSIRRMHQPIRVWLSCHPRVPHLRRGHGSPVPKTLSLTTAFQVGLHLLNACSYCSTIFTISTHFPWFGVPGVLEIPVVSVLSMNLNDYNMSNIRLESSPFRTDTCHKLRLSRNVPELKQAGDWDPFLSPKQVPWNSPCKSNR